MIQKGAEKLYVFRQSLPLLYSIFIFSTIVGPLYFSRHYFLLIVILHIYLSVRYLWALVCTVLAAYKANSLIQGHEKSKTLESVQKEDLSTETNNAAIQKNKNQFLHAFIIPSYNQDDSLLRKTLQYLACIKNSESQCLVFLAMEQHEPNSSCKALMLIEEFKSRFRFMHYTSHVWVPHQLKGKAANLNWCVRHMEKDCFIPLKIDPDSVMLTIIDADSWVPNMYIREVNRQIQERYSQRHRLLFHPPQIFTQNRWKVPIITRIYDMGYAHMQFFNLYSLADSSFSLSNYSFSYRLAKDIGLWDTCPDSIADDTHIDSKSLWQTNGEVKIISIYTPFNQACLKIGKGYMTDLIGRFWQAERHGRGCIQISYIIGRIYNDKWNWRSLLWSYQFIELVVIAAIYPCLIVGKQILGLAHGKVQSPFNTPYPPYIDLAFVLPPLFIIISFAIYAYIFEKASRAYFVVDNSNQKFKLKDLKLITCLRVLEYITLSPILLFIFIYPSFVIGAFRVTFGSHQYKSSSKKVQ